MPISSLEMVRLEVRRGWERVNINDKYNIVRKNCEQKRVKRTDF